MRTAGIRVFCALALCSGVPAARAFTNGFLTVGTPPNPSGAVGTNRLMAVTNPEFLIQDRTGGVVSAFSHLHFWTNNAGVAFAPGGYAYAPRVLYDPGAARWIAAAGADPLTTNAAILLAVSQTGDPAGGWDRYRIPVDPEAPLAAATLNVGFNRKWIAVHANVISGTNFPAAGDFSPGQSLSATNVTLVRTELLVFDKAGLYTNATAGWTRFELGSNDWHMVPAVTTDEAEDTLYLAHIPRLRGMPQLSTVTGPVGAETFTLGAATCLVADTWQYYQPGLKEFGPQRGSTHRIDLMDGRIRDLVYRNGALWMCHTVFLPFQDATRSAVQWWQVRPDGGVLQRGRVEDPDGGVFYAYPSLAVNASNDVLIGFSAFSTSFYASAGYAYRAGTDPPGTQRAPRLTKAGEAPYRSAETRRNVWGEYSAAAVDPSDGARMWTLQTYAHAPANRWSTWWAAVRAPPEADLALRHTASAAVLRLGSNVVFTLTVTNRGPAATEATLVNPLPPQLAFVAADAGAGTVELAGGTVTYHLGVLASHTGTTVTLTAEAVTPGAADSAATVWTGVETDPYPADNTATASVCVRFDVIPNVWINEIHYDDANTLDVNEGIEIAGPAGTVLDGLELVFYRGTFAGGEVYLENLPLSGVIDHETNGYGAVWFDRALMGNGGLFGHGVALVPACTGVIQFLSYEGVITATEGPAAGETSEDIGVAEDDTTPEGYSLQLTGNGIGYGDFGWQAPVPHSRGFLNAGQTVPVDADGDGIPSWWEYLYFGGPTNAAPGADGDNDGLNELGEYTADTVPNDSNSFFAISFIAVSNGVARVAFESSAQRVYGVDAATNLAAPAPFWTHVRTNLAGTDGLLWVPDTNAPAAARFYRARVRVPDP
ncbi:MAG: DUF11 domain-containing protein [Lentisphaerae bacterium]|nr:DUF11 domain-containing protein [Lentisphaerota bacterium]